MVLGGSLSYQFLSSMEDGINSSARAKTRRHGYLAQGTLYSNHCMKGVRTVIFPSPFLPLSTQMASPTQVSLVLPDS